MKTVLSVIFLASLIAVPVLAQPVPDEGPDSFGVYFLVDDSWVVNVQDVAPNTFVPTYIILAGISRLTVGGWEVALDISDAGDASITDTVYLGDGLNYAEVPSFIVGLPVPVEIPPEGYLVLAELNVLFFAGVVEWLGGPTDPATIPLMPAYVNGEDLQDVVGCYFSTDVDGQYIDENGWTTMPLATVNGNVPIATENASWSDVKKLYR